MAMHPSRSLRHSTSTAIFHIDTLHLCLNSEDADDFEKMTAAVARELSVGAATPRGGAQEAARPLLIRHCHEFVHYHQFAGTRFGLVYRRLLATRARLREELLQEIGEASFRSLVEEGPGRGPLIRVASATSLTVHPVLRQRADRAVITLLGWLDALEAYLLSGEHSELFASSKRMEALLEACVAYTSPAGDLDVEQLLQTLESEPDAGPGTIVHPTRLFPICEAQATINEAAMLGLMRDGEFASRPRSWFDSSYWEVQRRFGWSEGTEAAEFPALVGAVLLATDIALDGRMSSSGAGGCLVFHPTLALDRLVGTFRRWRKVLDRPLEEWSRDDFLERRSYIANVALGRLGPHTFVVPDADPALADQRAANPAFQYVGMFAALGERITRVKSVDPAAALYPTGTILARPESFEGDGEHIAGLACPFLAVGGVPFFSNFIDEETWARWRLLSGYEVWLDNLYGGWGESLERLAGAPWMPDTLNQIAMRRVTRSPGPAAADDQPRRPG